MMDLLFHSVQQTLKAFAEDKKYLGAKPGILLALHTWGRNLQLHAHLHVLISHGGIAENGEWVEPKKKILFPQKAVMLKFRGKFLGEIKAHLETGKLVLPEGSRDNLVKSLLNRVGRKEWTVHFCNQYVHGKGVAKYLARYVKGGAFNNQQIKSVENGQVKFQYKSHQTKRYEWLNLPTKDFVKRIAEHLLPPRKCAMRYGGLYSPTCRRPLNEARAQLKQTAVPEKVEIDWQVWLVDLGHSRVCAQCKGQLIRREALPRERRA
jgi:hypothetical protein